MYQSKSILCFSCVLIVCALLTIWHVPSCVGTTSGSSSGNGTVREWLTDLNDQAATLQSSASRLEKVIAVLSTANNTASIINMRSAQLKKINQALDMLNQEISIVKLTCNNNGGADCTIPICVSICLNCTGPGKCGVCPYNLDGNDCSTCKSGWSNYASNCTIPICDSKCLNCSSPGMCIACSDNWDGSSCSSCKQGWNGSICSVPICDSKCLTCQSPGNCTNCSGNWTGSACSVPVCDSKCLNCSAPANCSTCIGNWIGSACSTCKSGWVGSDCNTPICDTKCTNCSSPGVCSNCTGNWNGTTCSTCKTGWTGSNCTTPVCDAKCTTCTSPGVCSVCSGNWNGATCSTCKSGWTGATCSTPVCDAKCTTCASPGVCSVCSTGWTGATCASPVCDAKCTTCASPGVCSVCSTGWTGATCTTPVCDTKCTTCASPGVCSVCSTGWTGATCSTPVCDAKCTTCTSPGVCSVCSGNYDGATCSTCKTGWYLSDCSTNIPPPILTSAQITKFTTNIMPNAQLTTGKLLYKALRDGFSASTFHSKCDNKGPTIVIVKATSGAIFGGYTSLNWQPSGGYMADTNSFLFSLVSAAKEERFTKLTYNTLTDSTNMYAISIYPDRGPTFGGGHDFTIFSNANTNTASYSNLCNSYCDTTMRGGSTTSNNYLAGSYNFQVEDYEVYSADCPIGYSGPSCNVLTGDMGTSTLFSNSYGVRLATLLSQVIKKPPKLLYRAMTNGYHPYAFHGACNGYSSTVTVVKTSAGALFGAYLSIAWEDYYDIVNYSKKTFADPNAFLFSMVTSTGLERFVKLGYTGATVGQAVTYNFLSHPLFGASDIYLGQGMNYQPATDAYSKPMTFAPLEPNWQSGTTYSFTVNDYEVYSV